MIGLWRHIEYVAALLPIQPVVYRQVMYLLLIQAVVSALSGRRLRRHRLRRSGDLDIRSHPVEPSPL